MTPHATITKDTRVPLGWVAGGATLLIVSTFSVAGMFNSIRSGMQEMQGQMDQMRSQLIHLGENKYTLDAAERAAMRQAAANPGLVVPNPRDPRGEPFHYPRSIQP